MIEIPLTKGKVAIIDEDDFVLVSLHDWWLKTVDTHSYAETKVNGKNVTMHRLLLEPPKGIFVDHRDANGLNNRRNNLRLATPQQNCWNIRKYPGREYKGVSFRKDRGVYRAYITLHDTYQHLGHFSTAEEAAVAYDKAALKLFGEFANMNFPEVNA